MIRNEEEYQVANERRCELIDKDIEGGGLTREEQKELAELELQVSDYNDLHHPVRYIDI